VNPCEVVGQIPVVVDKILFDPLLYMSISHEIREWSVCRPALHNESCRVSRELAAPLYTLNWLSFQTALVSFAGWAMRRRQIPGI